MKTKITLIVLAVLAVIVLGFVFQPKALDGSNFLGSVYKATQRSRPRTSIPTASSCAPAPSELLAWWPMEGSGNDVIGGNNGERLGALGFVPGLVGQALQASYEDFVNVPYSPSLDLSGEFTMMAWAQGDFRGRIMNRIPNYQLGFSSLSPEVVLQRTDNSLVTARMGVPPTFDPETWFHVAGVKRADSLEIYLNGSRTGSTPLDYPFPRLTNSRSLLLGDGFIGKIDEAMIFNRALRSEEINRISSARSRGVCRP